MSVKFEPELAVHALYTGLTGFQPLTVGLVSDLIELPMYWWASDEILKDGEAMKLRRAKAPRCRRSRDHRNLGARSTSTWRDRLS
jgi:hypothetical protein